MNAFYDSPGFGEMSIFEDKHSGFSILRADRLPCPVCGHPTGDCEGNSASLLPEDIWGYNTHSSLDDSLTFCMQEDYCEEREIAPGIVTKMVIHKKGKNISIAEARRLGFLN